MFDELNNADTGAHTNEVPMPETQTEGDVQPQPTEPPHMPGPHEGNPAHPESDRA